MKYKYKPEDIVNAIHGMETHELKLKVRHDLSWIVIEDPYFHPNENSDVVADAIIMVLQEDPDLHNHIVDMMHQMLIDAKERKLAELTAEIVKVGNL